MDNMDMLGVMCGLLGGESTEEIIDNHYRRNQQKVVRNVQLPKKINDTNLPREIRWKNITEEMGYWEGKAIQDKNNAEYTKSLYEKMGITIKEEDADNELFFSVNLPDGWSVKPTDHNLWTDLLDEKQRKRGMFFYKASFGDSDAFINFYQRYSIAVEPFDNYLSDATYEERSGKPWYGIVKDTGKEIFRTKGVRISQKGKFKKTWEIDEYLKKLVLDYINEKYPDWEDIFAYWD